MRTSPFILSLTLLAALGNAQAAEPTKEQLDFFEKKVRPILSDKCYKCHSVEAGKSKGGLTLDTQAATLKGGEGGPRSCPRYHEQSLDYGRQLQGQGLEDAAGQGQQQEVVR